MEYTWHMEDVSQESNSRTTTRQQSRGQGPGFIEDLDIEAYMEGCYPPQAIDPRRTGGHQLPESPPDSGSENPYSPSEAQAHAIAVPQTVLGANYMLVHDHIPTHEILQQNGEYIYEELKTDNIDPEVLRTNFNDVVVLPQDPSIVELGIRTVRHDLGIGDVYQNRYNQMRVDMPEIEQGLMTPQLVALGHDSLTPVYTSLQEPNAKKRKHDQDASQVKCEPAALSPESSHVPRPAPPSVDGSEAGDDAPMQCIRFSTFQQNLWHNLYDCNLKPLQPPSYVVGADKGFNYSQIDEAFVCQKKNHFQVTCQIHMQGDPQYVKTSEGFKKINNFCLHFYGVKAEDPSQEVRIEQSQSDRTKKPFHPVPVELRREGAKVTVGRLHFAETTNNNMRKKGRPNPDQRHFQLVVALRAHLPHAPHHLIVAASASDRIIVRASNPGQFESDCTESWWQRGVSENSVHFNGRVGINTDRPDECCVVNGNLKVMGHILHPSDVRAKHNIAELDTAQQLRNVQSIRVVNFNYDPSFAEHSGLLGYDPSRPAPPLDTGIIAQEVRRVLPEAVKEAGDVTLPNGDTISKFLVVNKDRIYMEGIGAVKELSKVTGNLESRIDQLERINKKLYKVSILQRRDSSRSSVSNDSRYSAISNSSKSLYSDGNISVDQIRDIARNIRKHERCHKLSHYSPKHTRKQCKNCHSNYSKYGKFYNQNKTCDVRYHSKKLETAESVENPTYTESHMPSYPDDGHSTLSKKKDTCLWLKSDDDFSYGNSRLGFCCRKDYRDSNSELISNKFLQIVITILIFIMAVCLIVMSALYFQEHKELISIREANRLQSVTYNGFYKPLDKTREAKDFNQIQNLKQSNPSARKMKEKGSHKTTQEYITTAPTEPPHTVSTTTTHSHKNYVSSRLRNAVPTLVQAERPVARKADVVGAGCSSDNTNNELDPECQSPCIDPPQAYDNQDDHSKPDKELNDTYIRPVETLTVDKLPNIPVILDKNHTESLKTESESYRNENDSFKVDANMPENNFLDNKSNVTENRSRMKREIKRKKRDERSSEELIHESEECDSVRVGVLSVSKPILNSSLFSDTVCDYKVFNFSYEVPLSLCLTYKQLHLTFSSSKLQEIRLCHQCNLDSSNSCQSNREPTKAALIDNVWTINMNLECHVDKMFRVRASFKPFKKDICTIVEPKIPFIEYNIRIHRDCRN